MPWFFRVRDRAEVDMIKLSGPAFPGVDNRLRSKSLILASMSPVCYPPTSVGRGSFQFTFTPRRFGLPSYSALRRPQGVGIGPC